MPKRPFVVSEDEQPIALPLPSAQELEDDTARLLRKFANRYGKDYPRLLAALRATNEGDNV